MAPAQPAERLIALLPNVLSLGLGTTSHRADSCSCHHFSALINMATKNLSAYLSQNYILPLKGKASPQTLFFKDCYWIEKDDTSPLISNIKQTAKNPYGAPCMC